MSTSATTPNLTITDTALTKIREVMAQQKLDADEKNLRVFVESGGGCCGGGPSFGLAFDRAQDGDSKFALGGMNVIVDPTSLPYCAGATIDYIDTPQMQGFKVNAPAMQKESSGCGSGGCGCGSGGGGGGCGSGQGHSHGQEHGHSHGGGGGCGSGGGGCGSH
jgi:iron-sulfur cluster assembly accessory protein